MTLQKKSIISNAAIHILFIFGIAFCITLLPFFVMQVPLDSILTSDAQWHVAHWSKLAQPDIFEKDLLFSSQTSKPYIIYSGKFSLVMSEFFRLSLQQFTIIFSFFALILFLTGLYLLLYTSISSGTLAFTITAISIIPIHQLGGATFGFLPYGLLPRDFGLAISFIPIILFALGAKKNSQEFFFFTFLSLGILSNLYPPIFFHLTLLFLLILIIIKRKITKIIFIYFFTFLIGTIPTFIETFTTIAARHSLDTYIYHLYYKYMLPAFASLDFFQYVRRTIIYIALIILSYIYFFRKYIVHYTPILRVWYGIACISIVFSVIGIVIEHSPTYAALILSRYSLWLTLSSLVIIGILSKVIIDSYPRLKVLIYASLIFILLFQSNIPTMYRVFLATYKNREEIIQTHIALTTLKKYTKPNELILAPPNEYDDIPAKIRAYANRSVYVAYKDGAFSMGNGDLARLWYDRLKKTNELFQTKNPASLLAFMEKEGIQYAFVPVNYYDTQNSMISGRTVRLNNYLLIKL